MGRLGFLGTFLHPGDRGDEACRPCAKGEKCTQERWLLSPRLDGLRVDVDVGD